MKRERDDLIGKWTPWGATQDATEWAPGIVFHSTAGHGGFHLDRGRMAHFRRTLPTFVNFTGGPWFEEDCDAAVVVVVFPEAFEPSVVAECREQIELMAKRDYETMVPVAEWLATQPVGV